MRVETLLVGLFCVCVASAWIARHASRSPDPPPAPTVKATPLDAGAIRGRLREGAGPLPFGVVELSARGRHATLPADREGRFAGRALPPGVWTVEVRLPSPNETVVHVEPDRVAIGAGRTELIEVDATVTR